MDEKLIKFILLCYFLFFFANPVAARTEKTKVAGYEIEYLEKAILNFKNDVGRFPTQDEGLKVLISRDKVQGNWKGPYINKPLLPLDSWNHPYSYVFPAKQGNKEFGLYSYGPNGVDQYGLGDDIANWENNP